MIGLEHGQVQLCTLDVQSLAASSFEAATLTAETKAQRNPAKLFVLIRLTSGRAVKHTRLISKTPLLEKYRR